MAGSSDQNAPPMIVVTTASSGQSHRREQKIDTPTPTILVKPPTSTVASSGQNQSPNQAIGNNSNHSHGNNHYNYYNNSNAYNNYNYNSNNNNNAPNGNTNNNNQNQQIFKTEKNDKDVDSALLSALRDKRERMALLRLEKNLIDFMNEKNCGFMEVGGPFNNIVIRGASGGFGDNSNSGSNNNTNSNTASADGMAGGVQQHMQSGGGMGGGGGMNMNGYSNAMNMNDNGREGRQTSFQRLCLHRLADRFNIVRQSNMHSNNTNSNTPYVPNLIRLVKVKESRIPTVKLINLDMADYETSHTQNIPQDRGDSFEGGGYGVRGITDHLNGTHLDNSNNGPPGTGSNNGTNTGTSTSSGKKSKKKEKVKKIMKRSPNSSSGSLNKSADSSTKRRGKKLSEKEKAYAEARARIFNTQESSTSNVNPNSNSTNLDGSDHANSTTNDINVDAASSAFALESTVSAESASASPDRLSPVSPNNTNSTVAAAATRQSPPEAAVNYYDESTNAHSNVHVPAAAKGGAESKVLWRNRQQEASDPDFRRAHHPIMVPQPVVYQQHQHFQPSPVLVPTQVAYAPPASAGYHYQGNMDQMSYSHSHNHNHNRNGQHAYYQQQHQQHTMHQMHNGGVQYNAYSQHPYDGGIANDRGKITNKKQATPVYTEEEFPALG
jgi:hypothetical protein